MLLRLLQALVIWIAVAVGLWILAELLLSVGTDITTSVGEFLDRTNVVIGFLCGLWYFFFGGETWTFRR